MGSVLLLNEV